MLDPLRFNYAFYPHIEEIAAKITMVIAVRNIPAALLEFDSTQIRVDREKVANTLINN